MRQSYCAVLPKGSIADLFCDAAFVIDVVIMIAAGIFFFAEYRRISPENRRW